MSSNSLPRQARSRMEIKNAIRAARKFATDHNTPEDPNEVSTPSVNKENIPTPEDRDMPTKQPSNTEGTDAGANTPLETLTAAESTIAPEKGENVCAESKVSTKSAALLDLINKKRAAEFKPAVEVPEKKEASAPETVATGLSFSEDTLKKIASIMLSTEEGTRQVANAVAKARADGMKLDSINELIEINKQYKAEQLMRNKYASYANAIDWHATEMNRMYQQDQALKYAYAQGAQDAQAAMAAQGAAPAPEQAAPAPQAQQNEAVMIVEQLVQSGMVDPNAAQQLVALAEQMSGGQPMTPELMMAWIEQAVQQGLLAPEVAQQIVGGASQPQGGAAPAPAAPTPEQQKVAHIVDVAQRLLFATAMIKKAAVEAGEADSEEVEPEDVDAVADVAVENGEISPEEAEAATDLIASEASGAEGGAEGDIEALAEELDAIGATPEEVEEALAELAAEEGAMAGDPSGNGLEETVGALLEAGVPEEEIAQALQEIEAEAAAGGEQEISDAEAQALAEELADAGIDEQALAKALADAEAGEAPLPEEPVSEEDLQG